MSREMRHEPSIVYPPRLILPHLLTETRHWKQRSTLTHRIVFSAATISEIQELFSLLSRAISTPYHDERSPIVHFLPSAKDDLLDLSRRNTTRPASVDGHFPAATSTAATVHFQVHLEISQEANAVDDETRREGVLQGQGCDEGGKADEQGSVSVGPKANAGADGS
jgi:hypothetical protein